MIYIQSDSERALPHHLDAACALFGAIDNNQKFRLTSFEEVNSGKFDNLIKTNLFVGTVEFMNEVFSRVGITDSGFNLLPDRSFEKMTIGSVRVLMETDGKPRFVKSVKTKVFTGCVIEDLKAGNMVKNHNLASAILDGGFYELKRQIMYKKEWYGGKVILANG